MNFGISSSISIKASYEILTNLWDFTESVLKYSATFQGEHSSNQLVHQSRTKEPPSQAGWRDPIGVSLGTHISLGVTGLNVYGNSVDG